MMKKNRKKITGIIMTIAMLLCLFPAMMVPASAAAGDTWTVQTSGVTANLNGVCYGGSTFVAVGANGTILTSSNGTSWINRTTTNSAATGGVELKAVCFGNGMFMAVGVGGKVITSSDGITWAAKVSETDALATDDLVAVAYGNNKFVALGKNSAGGYIYTSTDNGSNWGQTYSYSGYFLYGICYGNSQFVVVGDLDFINFDKEYGLVLVSADGQTWGDCKTDMAAQSFTSVCYGGTTYVAADIESRILKSSDPTDAAKWDNRGWQDTDYSSFNAVCYGGSTYVTVGFNGHIYISSDGSVWTSKTSNTSNALNSVCYGSTTFVTVGLGGTIVSSAGVVAPTAQTITFANPGAQNYGTTPTLTATASSGLAVSFTSDTPDVCTVTSGGALTFLKAGTATITAHQAGNASYLAASDVSQSFTVNATVPGAPTIGTATAGDAQATVNFTAPSSNGGSAITGYTVTSSPGGFTGTGDGSPITVTGLTNGTAYTFTVTATNTAGTGSASAASNSATPKAAQTITFANPGAQNFGTTPTLTATASSGLTVNFTSDTTDVCTVTSGGTLTFLKAGTATITAHQTGNGSFLAASDVSRSFTVNAIVPSAPTIGTATAGDTQATVTFTAPTSNGGSAITGYTVTSSPGGFTGTGAGGPITVTGLTNGVAYTFTVTATNTAGTGSASAASNSVTPKAAQTITFANPGAQNYGTTPTLTATTSSGLTVNFTSDTTDVCTVTSGGTLTFLKAGTATITAHQTGNGSFLAASDVSRSFTVNAIVPSAPTIGTATAGDTQATVTFTAPTSNGGSAITGYTVTANPGGATGTGAGSPITIPGLTNGVAYTFTVTATNTAGTGSASAASNSATPKAAQTITFANPGAQNFGTTPTLTATASSGLTVNFTSDTTDVCTVTSGGTLTFLKAGTATITAHQTGNGSFLAASDVSRSFTVNAIVPSAPTIGTATAGDTQATVTFTAPTSNGGSAITGYTVTSSPGGFTGTGDGSGPITVTGLTNGTAYTFTVTATNTAGTGSASAASNSATPKAAQTITFANPGAQNFGTTPTLTATASSGLTVNFTSDTTDVCTVTSGGTLTFLKAGTATITAHQTGNGSFLAASDVSRSFTVNAIVPSAPTIGTATAGDTQATVTFTAPTSNGGSAITGYTVTSSPGGFMGTGDGSSPITVTGLTNGTAYTFTVTATNSAGAGSASAASNSVTPYGNSTITPTTAAFDKYTSATNYKDLTVTLILNGNTLNSIKNGADTLVLNTDYTTSGNTITIKKEYLKNLSTGTVNLTFDFSLGTDRTLSVTVSDSTPTSGGSTPAKTDSSTSTVVEVDGQKQDAGEKKTETADNGKTQTTVTVDDTKLNKILDTSGEKPIVTLPISEKTDVVVGELNGQTVKNMEQKEATLEIRTDTITYTLPASQINIDAVSSQIGSQVELKDIKVNVKIAEPPADTVKVVEDTANKNSYQIVVKPVEFEITCTSGSKTVQVSSFNGYVERTVAIPDGVDPSKITTGIVLNADGTFRHVPTQIVVINGKYFAKINSLTNSTYSVIWNPVTFTDVENHWAKSAVNDMGSRMVVTGVGNGSYEPGRSITRAEFATIVVRAMGLAKGTASSSFSDVSPDDWFNGYVDTATAYGLIAGYSKVAYGPNDTITREQAMAILARAMKITGLNVSLTDSEINALLAKYKDGADVSGYAREAVAACIKSGVIAGSSADLLSPKAYVSRAEVAVMVQRLLQKSGLI